MSSRVRKCCCFPFHEINTEFSPEKGGPIFRPVAKPRGRSTTGNSRQSSVAVDSRSSVTPSASADGPIPAPSLVSASPNDMPPPTVIPSAIREASCGPDAQPLFNTFHLTPNDTAPPSTPMGNLPNATPPPSTMIIQAPVRRAPVLLTVGQSRTHAERPPLLLPSQPGAVPASAHSNALQSEHPSQSINRVPMGPPPVSFQGFGIEQNPSPVGESPDTEPSRLDLPKVTINNVIAVKPQPKRKAGRKKKVPEVDGEAAPDDTAKKTRKAPRIKKVAATTVPEQADGTNGDSVGQTEESMGAKRKRRSSSVPRRPRKPRGPSHPPFDLDAGPGEELDPTVITMADLCSDTGQGRISTKAVQIQSNHTAWKASNREKRARMKMLMESKKYGKKDDAEETEAGVSQPPPVDNTDPDNAVAGPSTGSPAPSEGPDAEDETGQGFDYSQAMATSRFNVQVRIGPNGETIIDEESLFVDRNDENETVNYTHVEESDTTKFVNSATYGKKYRGSRWSAEETELFFNVNHSLMSGVYAHSPYRHFRSLAKTMS